MNRKKIIDLLMSETYLLKTIELMGPEGQLDERRTEKLREVAGFAEIIIRYLKKFPVKEDSLTVLECSCGKSYLGFVLYVLLSRIFEKKIRLVGIDYNDKLIQRCYAIAGKLKFDNVEFICDRIINYRPDFEVDLTVSLHACDKATDEALAGGILSRSRFVHAVPCCQNQIRGQLTTGHPLTVMTDYGPIRYRLANMLTDVMRAEFMHSAGYHVELDEISSPKITPKNLCISCRKVKRKSKKRRDLGYKNLRDYFGVKPAIEVMCPEVIQE